MKVLMYLQLSRNKDGKCVMSADSNWNFNKHVIRMFKERGDDIDVIIPNQAQRFDTDEELIKDLKCDANLLSIRYADDVLASRFYFNNDLIDIVRNKKYNLIYNNDPCLAGNWRAFSPQSKLWSYSHWMDTNKSKKSPDNLTFQFRQSECAELSDLYLFNSNFAIEEFQRELGFMIKHPKAKMIKFPPIAAESVGRDESRRIKILFNHRLSQMSAYKTNFDNFCSVVAGLDVEVYIANAEGKIPKFNIPHSFKMVQSRSLQDYNALLKNCNTQLNCFTYDAMWNMGAVDSIVNHYNMLTLSIAGFKELTPSRSYSQCKNLDIMRSRLVALLREPKIYEDENLKNCEFIEKNCGYNVSKNHLEELLNDI